MSIHVEGGSRRTVDNEFNDGGLVALMDGGSAVAPSIAFVGDTDTGLYQVGSDNVGISTGGTKRFDVTTTEVTSTLPLVVPAASAGTPSLGYMWDRNTGVYSTGGDVVALSCGGTQTASLSTSALEYTSPLTIPVGSVGAPAMNFAGDPDTGTYSPNPNEIAIGTAGAVRMTISDTSISIPDRILAPDAGGSGSAFGFSESKTSGLYELAAGNIGWQTAGSERMNMSNSGSCSAKLPWILDAGTVGAPSMSFTGDEDTGLYYIPTDTIGFAAGGALSMTCGPADANSSVPVKFPTYTVAGKPSASVEGRVIYISNDAGTPNQVLAYADGTNWRRFDTAAVLT